MTWTALLDKKRQAVEKKEIKKSYDESKGRCSCRELNEVIPYSNDGLLAYVVRMFLPLFVPAFRRFPKRPAFRFDDEKFLFLLLFFIKQSGFFWLLFLTVSIQRITFKREFRLEL